MGLFNTIEQPPVANGKRPFPNLPNSGTAISREKQKFRPAHQIFERYETHLARDATISGIIPIITHGEIMAGRHRKFWRLIQRPEIALFFNDEMLFFIGQCFNILRNATHLAEGCGHLETIHGLAGHTDAIHVKQALLHLDAITGQTDDALDVIGFIVRWQFEHGNIATLRLAGP